MRCSSGDGDSIGQSVTGCDDGNDGNYLSTNELVPRGHDDVLPTEGESMSMGLLPLHRKWSKPILFTEVLPSYSLRYSDNLLNL